MSPCGVCLTKRHPVATLRVNEQAREHADRRGGREVGGVGRVGGMGGVGMAVVTLVATSWLAPTAHAQTASAGSQSFNADSCGVPVSPPPNPTQPIFSPG